MKQDKHFIFSPHMVGVSVCVLWSGPVQTEALKLQSSLGFLQKEEEEEGAGSRLCSMSQVTDPAGIFPLEIVLLAL